VKEAREVVVVRLVPSIEQQLEEALAEVKKQEASVASHPG
jgi:hypothetical protein